MTRNFTELSRNILVNCQCQVEVKTKLYKIEINNNRNFDKNISINLLKSRKLLKTSSLLQMILFFFLKKPILFEINSAVSKTIRQK